MKPPIAIPDEVLRMMMLLIEEVSEKMMSRKMKESPFYDSADLKMHLNIFDKTLQRWRKSGKIPYKKLGKKYFYPKSFFKT